MKNIFPGYIPTPLTIDEINRSIVTFDTNSILNLYRFRPETSADYLSALKSIPNNLWMPFMVALEYHSLRTSVIKQEQEFFESIKKTITTFKNKMLGDLNKEHKYFPFEEFKNNLLASTTALQDLVSSCQNSQKDIIRNDPIRDELIDIFHEKTGHPISSENLSKIYTEAERRFESDIPPGYCDKSNKAEEIKLYGDQIIRTKYSDFIIWHEIIQKAKEDQKSIVFVTDEKKDDWVLKINGYILGARPELVTELMIKANQKFYLTSSRDFISIMKKSGTVEISQSSVDDIEKVTSLSWRDIVIMAFQALGGESTLNELYDWIEESNPRPLSKNWKVTARKTIYSFCPDRDIFLGGEHLFDALPNGKYRLKNN